MGRSKSSPVVKAVKPPEETPSEPVKVSNLYEAGALKGALDEAAREVVLDMGYEEDVMINNIKIFLGLAAIGFAILAQFGPGKFPANWWMVFGCVVAYLILTSAMNLYSWQMERDAFLVTKPFRGSKGVRLSSRMARFTDEYTLVIADRELGQIEVQGNSRIPEFFHADGYLADAAWRGEVEKLCAAFAAKQAERVAKKRD